MSPLASFPMIFKFYPCEIFQEWGKQSCIWLQTFLHLYVGAADWALVPRSGPHPLCNCTHFNTVCNHVKLHIPLTLIIPTMG